VGRGAGTNLQVRIGAAPVFRTAVSACSSALDVAAPWGGCSRLVAHRLEPSTNHHSATDGHSGSRLQRTATARLEHRKRPHARVRSGEAQTAPMTLPLWGILGQKRAYRWAAVGRATPFLRQPTVST